VDADGRQCLANLVKLEGFDNGNNELHVRPSFLFNPGRSRLNGATATLASF
jgi:hypothetical protein